MSVPFGVTIASALGERPDSWAEAIEEGIRAGATSAGEAMREFVDRRFEEQRDPWGQPWKAHSPATLQIKVSLARGTAVRDAERTLLAEARANGGEITRASARRAGRRIQSATRRAERRLQGSKVLIDKGILRGSIGWELRDNGRRVVVFLGGAAAAYARVHQWGNPTNKVFGKALGPVPARPILPLRGNPRSPTVDVPRELVDELRETLRDAIRAALARQRASVRR